MAPHIGRPWARDVAPVLCKWYKSVQSSGTRGATWHLPLAICRGCPGLHVWQQRNRPVSLAKYLLVARPWAQALSLVGSSVHPVARRRRLATGPAAPPRRPWLRPPLGLLVRGARTTRKLLFLQIVTFLTSASWLLNSCSTPGVHTRVVTWCSAPNRQALGPRRLNCA